MNVGSTRAPRTSEARATSACEEDDAPPLWNPHAAANWSLLLSPAFGAALHMKNWRALGDEKRAADSKMWMIATLGVLLGMALAGMVLPESKDLDMVTRSVGMGLLFAWYFTAARAQQKLVKERFGKDYERRGWIKPLAYAALVVCGSFVVAMIVALLVGA